MEKTIIVSSKNDVSTGVGNFTSGLVSYLSELGLPTDQVLVPVTERQRVINNLPDVLASVADDKKSSSIYLSKFIAACAAGLFDAALNFIWDETVVNLRRKVARFDLEYFYDSVITDPNRRMKLKDETDLNKIEEWELIRGCHLTGILSDIGFKHLDYIRDMRNWASAAHPNQIELTGFQLISWLETCIKEVIAKEPEGPVIEIKRFLSSIRTSILTPQDANHINAGIEHLTPDLSTSLLRTLFGMYTSPNTAAQVKNNIKLVAKQAWSLGSEEIKYECGFKYATYASNGEIDRKTAANEFLTVVKGLPYLPVDTLAIELAEKISDLYQAHIGFNNFHSEPPHARALAAYVSSTGSIPDSVRKPYVKTLVMARIGNGYGVSRMAVSHYDQLIDRFGEHEFRETLLLVTDSEFESRVCLNSCRENYRYLVAKISPKATNQRTKQGFEMLLKSTDAQLPNLGKDTVFRKIFGLLKAF